MQIYVINLARRVDRRRFMEAQAERLGLVFRFIDAVDARMEDIETLRSRSRPGPLGTLSDGDLCCFLSHIRAWESIRDGADPFGVVLEDDVVLSGDARPYLADAAWIPAGERLVKLERFGNARHRVVLDRRSVAAHGRSLRRLRSKHAGAAAYVLSREAAGFLVDAVRVVDLSIDHFLFNPNNSPVFAALRPLQLDPAPAVQGGEVSSSDIHAMRVSGRTYDLAYWMRELVRGYYEIRLVPKLAWSVLTGRSELCRIAFVDRPARDAAAEKDLSRAA